MATIATGAICQVTARSVLNGQAVWNTFHYRLESGFGAPDYILAMDRLHQVMYTDDGSFFDLYKLALTADATLVDIVYQVISPIRLMRVVKTVTDAGEFVGVAETSNLSAVITRRGLNANRRAVGSLHMPSGTATAFITNGEIVAGFSEVLDGVGSKMIQQQVAVDPDEVWTPVIYNPGATPNYQVVQFYQVQPTVRVMRRRTVRVGI